MKQLLKSRLTKAKEPRKFTLRMSNIGKPCVRQLWLEKNFPEEKEKFAAHAILKFLYGDVIEELLLFLAEASGHTVEGRQDEQKIASILGHRDAVIDGMVVDVKSASVFSFKKFKDGLTKETDSFGYLGQIHSYLEAGQDDPIVTVKDKAAFFVMDKQNGHIHLDFHEKKPDVNIEQFYERRKAVVDGDQIPDRAFAPEPMGKSGNEKLPVNCSYCDLKWKCWPELRGFAYSYGPVYLSKVVDEPRVPEIFRMENKLVVKGELLAEKEE